MEYRTVATKLPSNELTMFRAHCEKKGVTPANLVRELILKEMKIPLPHNVAGRNTINYNKDQDSFAWSVKLDSGTVVEVIRNVSPTFLQDLDRIITISLEERTSYIHKLRDDSSVAPSYILKR